MSDNIDVSREAVEAMCLRFNHNVLSRPDCTAMLRALLDRAEKAEADNARLREALRHAERDLLQAPHSLGYGYTSLPKIQDALAATHDREQAERDKPSAPGV